MAVASANGNLLCKCFLDVVLWHLKNIYKEGELDQTATTEESSVVRQEGSRQVRRKIRFYGTHR